MENPNVLLTSSFGTVAKELLEKKLLPVTASVAFIPIAAHPYKETPWIESDRNALIDLGYAVTNVDILGATQDDLERALDGFDILFVAGGNTTYLVEHAHRCGLNAIVRDLLHRGKLFIGSSAGSILAGPTVEPFVAEDLPDLAKDFSLSSPSCFGLVDYIVLPHYPAYATHNDAIMEKYADRFSFAKLTDEEYRAECVAL